MAGSRSNEVVVNVSNEAEYDVNGSISTDVVVNGIGRVAVVVKVLTKVVKMMTG